LPNIGILDLGPRRKNMLGYYLAGLIEGDLSIIVPKTHIEIKNAHYWSIVAFKTLCPEYTIYIIRTSFSILLKITL
jgi:hypothetical protein